MAYDDQPYWDRPAMMESPSSGGFQDDWAPQDSPGLGLSAPEMAPIGQDASNDYRQFVGSLPLLDRMAMLRDGGGVTSLASQFMGQRQNLALKLQQQKEREQQFNWQEMLRIDKEYSNDPDKWQVGMQHLYQQRGFTPAGHMLQAGGKKMAGELASSLPFLQRYYPEFVKRYDQDPKSVSVAEVKSVLDGVQKLKAQRATADANAQELAALEKGYQAYLGGDKSAMMPGDAERLIELRNQAEKQNLEMEKLRLGNKKLAKEAEGEATKPDRSNLNRVALAETGQNFDDLPPGGPEQQKVIQAYSRMYAQGRQDVQLGAPIEQKTRTNLYTTKGLQNLNLERAPEGISEGEARRGGYVQLSDGEEKALTEYRVAKKTADSMFSVADRLITAKNPAEAAGQFARLQAGARTGSNGLAGAYLKDLEAFSSRIARLVEVGVMTNVDVTRWSNTFGSFGDTKQVLEAKKALFYEIQGEAERLLKMKLTGKPIEEQKTKLDTLLEQVDAVAEGKGRKKGFKGMSEQELQQKRKELFK